MSNEHEEDGASISSFKEILDDFIDVSHMDFDNQETWLLDVDSELKGMDNLHIWLTTSLDTEKMYHDSIHDSKKYIDTRTWTRPKKKFSRLSFESIIEGNSSNSSINSEIPYFNNETSRIEINLNEKTSSIPPILRPATLGPCSSTLTSGQESLEAFLNMSQTKGIDSFINMEAPEFNETLVGNSKSFCSNNFSINEDSQIMNQSVGMADSQILTESMMQTSMFSDVSDMNINDAFARDLSNSSIIENPNYAKPLNDTVIKSRSQSNSPLKFIDATFTTEELNQALDSHSFVINNDTFDTNSAEINHLSYIITSDIDGKNDQNITQIKENKKENLNSTFNSEQFFSDKCEEMKLDTTYISNKDENSANSLNSTINISKNDSKYLKDNTKSNLEITHDIDDIENKCLNSTFTSDVQINRRKTFKIEPQDLEKKSEPVISMANRFQTYRKSNATNQVKNPTRFTTISKDFEDNSNAEKQVKSCENLLDIRKTSQISKTLESNRNLSRLPQHLQKSNPNLISNSLKTVNSNRMSHFGFVRPKQVKNNEPSLTRKVYSLAKLKNGSDQRLTAPKVELAFSKSGGSTESIESTQSAASAPDLDDRLSVCSDGSNSCKSGLNVERVHNSIQMDSGNLKNRTEIRKSSDKSWYSNENDLPSPILKDGEYYGSRGSSPRSADSTVKTSSPILSPAESLQSINTTVAINPEIKTVKSQPESLPDKNIIAEKLKNREIKSGIRPPSARGLSGIPRPASRIPAPRFSRPSSNKI
ncbi:uncharacterized protein [Chelonus insularis]|uniref:uncharacterized protein n=1 Tax=Chelonus insularis TaxID=460826 RepID=UPI00158BD011|nr:uncharacterized protein LOC118072838 [Chelonus insularis]XP_034948865.1 uncharacterized protein LOC118072838 [Chelonus insularis]